MNSISIDIETYSSIDLNRAGVYRYAEADDFEILLFGYSVDGGEVTVIDLACGEQIPEEILDALTNPAVEKSAYNANFERVCLSAYLHKYFPGKLKTRYIEPISWICSLVWVAYLSLPLSLKNAGAVLNLDRQKLDTGASLIKYFCVPCVPTKINGGRTRNLPEHDPVKWQQFKEYNKRDVETEMDIKYKLRNHPVPDFVWEEYSLDQRINDRGILVDTDLAQKAIQIDSDCRTVLEAQIKQLTGLENPNSVMQLKKWLTEQGINVDDLGKKNVMNLIKTTDGIVKEVLMLRLQLAKSSIKKYQAMEDCVCKDGRARGMFQFYGANRTGRFSGRHLQLQNLPQNHLPDLDQARQLVKTQSYEDIAMLYDSVPDVLSQLIRTAFIPQDGCKFIVCDFSAIEARVLSWLAGEKWRMDVFANNGDIYCETASRMFHVPVVKHGINGELRQKGKQAELACGYGGSVGAMRAMGALDLGMKEEELKPLVDSWREANPRIVTFWWDIDHAVKDAVAMHLTTEVSGVRFVGKRGMLEVILPSGRALHYIHPRFAENAFGGTSIEYDGIGTNKKWTTIESYGPKFCENITQAISRDVLCHAMKNLSAYRIVAHVHDEVIVECSMETTVEEISGLMSKTPAWAEGLVLRADGYECMYYQKD